MGGVQLPVDRVTEQTIDVLVARLIARSIERQVLPVADAGTCAEAQAPASRCSQSAFSSAYSTASCFGPLGSSGQGERNVRASLKPAFSMTRLEAVWAASVEATTHWTPSSVKPLRTNARETSVAYPWPQATRLSR